MNLDSQAPTGEQLPPDPLSQMADSLYLRVAAMQPGETIGEWKVAMHDATAILTRAESSTTGFVCRYESWEITRSPEGNRHIIRVLQRPSFEQEGSAGTVRTRTTYSVDTPDLPVTHVTQFGHLDNDGMLHVRQEDPKLLEPLADQARKALLGELQGVANPNAQTKRRRGIARVLGSLVGLGR